MLGALPTADVLARWFAGLLFVSAALAKAFSPVADSHFVTSITASTELILGVWLFCSWHPRVAVAVAGSVLTAFTVAALYRATRAASCNCFGPFSVHPVLSSLTTALGAVCLGWSLISHRTSRSVAFRSIAASFATVVSVVVFVVSSQAIRRPMNAPPVDWADSVLARMDQSARSSLSKGLWQVLVIQHDCNSCRLVIEQLAAPSVLVSGERLMLAELPPFMSEAERKLLPVHGDVSFGRLEGTRPPCLPAAIRLKDGLIIGASCVKDDPDFETFFMEVL